MIAGGVACAILGPHWPHGAEPWLRITGLVVEATGLALVVAGRISLGRSFTPLPRPRERGTLRRGGVYAYVRHPIYGGLLVAGIGLALHHSALVFLPTAVLSIVFLLKSMREEAWLASRYPDYDAYRRATPHRFVPWLA